MDNGDWDDSIILNAMKEAVSSHRLKKSEIKAVNEKKIAEKKVMESLRKFNANIELKEPNKHEEENKPSHLDLLYDR